MSGSQLLGLGAAVLTALHPAFSVKGEDWPQWRGPERSGCAVGGTVILSNLPAEPTRLWKKEIGSGFSSPIVVAGKVVYLDAQGEKEIVHAVEAETGRELWQHELAEAFGDEWGRGPRSTPFASRDLLFAQSCNGEFHCLSLADGRLRWRHNFENFGITFLGGKAKDGTALRRGNNGSGVADAERVYVPVGSTNGATVVAFERATGREIWRALHEETAYSSLMLATLAGCPQVVAFTADSLAGLDCLTGKVLWQVPFRTAAKRHAATPVIMGDLVIVNSHTFGTVATRISREGDRFKATEAWANRTLKINLSTPVPVGAHLYSHGAERDFVCIEIETGKVAWSAPGFGKGKKDYCSVILAGTKLLVLSEDGQLTMLEARPDKYVELGRAQVCGNTWAHAAWADGCLYVRDGRQLQCYRLGKP